MAASKSDVLLWLTSLPPHDERVAVDDGGLTLVALDKWNEPTGSYYEIGGVPVTDDEDE